MDTIQKTKLTLKTISFKYRMYILLRIVPYYKEEILLNVYKRK